MERCTCQYSSNVLLLSIKRFLGNRYLCTTLGPSATLIMIELSTTLVLQLQSVDFIFPLFKSQCYDSVCIPMFVYLSRIHFPSHQQDHEICTQLLLDQNQNQKSIPKSTLTPPKTVPTTSTPTSISPTLTSTTPPATSNADYSNYIDGHVTGIRFLSGNYGCITVMDSKVGNHTTISCHVLRLCTIGWRKLT